MWVSALQSKALFLSSQIVHKMHSGIVLYICFISFDITCCQPSSKPFTFWGITQTIPRRFRNDTQHSLQILQWSKSCSTVSWSSWHRKHLLHRLKPFFCKLLSWDATRVVTHPNHATLRGAFVFHIFQGQKFIPLTWLLYQHTITMTKISRLYLQAKSVYPRILINTNSSQLLKQLTIIFYHPIIRFLRNIGCQWELRMKFSDTTILLRRALEQSRELTLLNIHHQPTTLSRI